MKTECNRCSKRLTVDETLVGQQVRCPNCEYTFEAQPLDGPNSAPPVCVGDRTDDRIPPERSGEQPSEGTPVRHKISRWFFRIPEGQDFGPVDRDTLDTWVREGRVASDCYVRRESEDAWCSPVGLYPMLEESGNPFASQAMAGPVQDPRPHRGKLVFGLSILGCLVPFLSLWPAVIGTRDLRSMVLGKMDPAGDAMTRAGQAIAMVSSMIWIGAFAVALLALLVGMMNGF